MQRIPRSRALGYLLSKDLAPVLRVRQGEAFVVETEDNVEGCLRSEDRLPTVENVPGLAYTPAKANPVAGPIYVEGAGKGDTLAVHIDRIEPDMQGVTFFGIGIGPLDASPRWPELGKPFTKIIRHEAGPSGTTRDGRAIFNDRVSWELEPFIGTIATAPEWEAESAVLGQGLFGGNMDVRDIQEGNTLLLNCFAEGGLLFVGDVHASQSDSEWYAAANECRAELELRCEVIKGKRIPNPRIETPETIIQLCSDKPLEAAVNRAMIDLVDWMVTDYGVNAKDAYMFMSICPDVRIHVYQMCPIGRLRFTVGVEIAKRHLV
jgi:acetamidase/formamidase